MSVEKIWFAVSFLGVFASLLMFVLFGQITVRKLRKNPETKNELGSELVSGWDILNVAQALALPRGWIKRFENSMLSSFFASSDILYKNTSKFDRLLGRVFWWMYFISGSSLILLVLLKSLGVFGD